MTMNIKKIALVTALFLSSALSLNARADWMEELPRPVYESNPGFVELYYKAWELAYAHIDSIPGLPTPRYMDEAHASNLIWIWDTCFMAQFCKYCPSVFPGIESLDNFYELMLSKDRKELPKVIGNKWSGEGQGKLLDFRVQHPDNPPLFAWAEYCYAIQTGNTERLRKVFSERHYLQDWHSLFDSFDPEKPQPYGSNVKVAAKKYDNGYAWKGCPSGMDNTPRGRTSSASNLSNCPDNPDLRWIDAISYQALSALCLNRIAEILGDREEAETWLTKHRELSEEINSLYWDESDGCYYDIFSNGKKSKVMTIASYWPLLAWVASDGQAAKMLQKLDNPEYFGGMIPTCSLSRSDADFVATGGYWRGSVWMPTTYMALKAADQYGAGDIAKKEAVQILEHMYRTYTDYEPHTIWECYSPTEFKPATNKKGQTVRPDFCGWSALGPISLFIEDVIGIREANAFTGTLVCDFEKNPEGRVGVENYRFGDIVCSVIADKRAIVVDSNKPFTLIEDGKKHQIRKGHNRIIRK